MSTLIGLRLGDAAVLATDSRIMDNSTTCVLSDSEQKIFEIAPGTFYAWSGYSLLASPQVGIATGLARTADMQNIRAFANSLDAMSGPLMSQLLVTLAKTLDQNPEKYGAELKGEKPFHAYIIAGYSNGTPGFLGREFYLINGAITYRETDGFNLPPGTDFTMYVTYGELLADAVPNPKTWAKGPVAAVEGFVDIIRRGQPLVGGPTQLVCVDKSGARWVHRPAHLTQLPVPQLATGNLPVGVSYLGAVNASQLTAGTVTAAISMTSPSLTISSGATTINLDSVNQIKISKSGYVSQIGTGFSTAFGSSDGLYLSGAGGTQVAVLEPSTLLIGGISGTSGPYFVASGAGFSVNNPGFATAGASPGQFSVTGVSTGGDAFSVNGSQVLSTRVGTTPSTLTDVIAILQHHGLCN